MKWRPIKTAPHNWDEVLVFSEKDGGCFVAFYDCVQEEWCWTSHHLNGDECVSPTHWMPLPEPPEA